MKQQFSDNEQQAAQNWSVRGEEKANKLNCMKVPN